MTPVFLGLWVAHREDSVAVPDDFVAVLLGQLLLLVQHGRCVGAQVFVVADQLRDVVCVGHHFGGEVL